MKLEKIINDELGSYPKERIISSNNRVILVDNIPRLGPLAFTHKIYQGITIIEKKELLKIISVPKVYVDFLEKFNGLDLFRGTINFHGYRDSQSNTRSTQWLPYDIRLFQVWERNDFPAHLFIVGSANGGELRISINLNDSTFIVSTINNPNELISFENITTLISYVIVNSKRAFSETQDTVPLF